MPTYEFRCSACRKTFAVTMKVADFDRAKIKCPRCGKKDINQVFSNFSVKTSRKS
ncbi:MAG: zinc ribbon domain-containing protein [Proteobacteria bacterium]|nr:zinc ribbon domain-containing protein [Pseudomonadota bacterium]